MQGWKKVAGAGCVGAVALGGSVGTAFAEVEVHRVNEELLKSGFPPPGHDPENDASYFTSDTTPTGRSRSPTSSARRPAGAPAPSS